MPKYSVIVPAAGKGDRFGGKDKKTFAKIDGRPMFLRTLERFVTREDVCQTLLVVAPEDSETMKSKYGANLGFMGVKLSEGGGRRCDSVAAALAMVSEEAEYVAVHDAARPCVSDDLINAVFAEAVKSNAAILAVPVSGTLKRVSDANVIDGTVLRESLFEAQTPQVFRKDVLIGAYERLGELGEDVTDDSQLVELAGHAVTVVTSDVTNIKITTRGDLTMAHAILKSRPIKKPPRMGAFEEAQW